MFLYVKDLHKPKHQYLINKSKETGLKHLKAPRAFVEYSNDMNDVYRSVLDGTIQERTETF